MVPKFSSVSVSMVTCEWLTEELSRISSAISQQGKCAGEERENDVGEGVSSCLSSSKALFIYLSVKKVALRVMFALNNPS